MKFLKDLFGSNKNNGRLEKIDLTKRFDLMSRVGQGSMSKVWKARDSRTGRIVAVKVLDKEKTEKLEARFKGLEKPTEGEIAVQLKHKNIVETLEHGLTKAKEQFLVMEFVDGAGLSFFVDMQNDTMKAHRLDFMIQLAEGIEQFHNADWIHRDICPRNVMVSSDNVVKLIDFGLVVPNTPEYRRPGNRTGTANYMAPELVKRQSTDQRLDVFSFAVTCFEMYTQQFPWEAARTLDAVVQHINHPPKKISQYVPNIDADLETTIMKGLATNPDDRWQSIAEMKRQLMKVKDRVGAGG
ncbi:MAG: serine/threonine-protein kinase [Planctomycetota bacterium]|nr:serine/threonine-protein kinase [Planctomycetota bacterium]